MNSKKNKNEIDSNLVEVNFDQDEIAMSGEDQTSSKKPTMTDIFRFAQALLDDEQENCVNSTTGAARVSSLDSLRKTKGISLLKVKGVNSDVIDESEIEEKEPLHFKVIKQPNSGGN